MKNLIFCLVFILVGCSKSNKIDPDGLKYGESYVFDKSLDAKIAFVDVQDGRCCRQCKCFIAGWITVTLDVTSPDTQKQTIKLFLALKEEDRSAIVKIKGQNFKIYFVSVYPDNEDWSSKKEDYSVVLQITKI